MTRPRLSLLFLNSIRPETWGGGEKWIVNAAAGLRDMGHRVLLAGRPGSQWLMVGTERGLPTRDIPIRGDLGPVNIVRLSRIIRSRRVDVIVTNFDKELRLAAAAARLAGRGVLVAGKGLPLIADRPLYRYSYRHLLRAVMVPSRDMKERIDRFPWVPTGLVRVLPYGVDPPETDGLRGSLRRELGIPASAFLVGMMSRLERWKGGHIFIDAARMVLERHSEVHFILAGKGSAEAALAEQIEQLGLGGSVHLIGFRSPTAPVLADLDLLCLPSFDEGLPNTVLESMAAGVPVIGSRVGGVPEMIEHERTGLLVEAGDSAGLGRAMLRMIEDGDLRDRLNLAAQEKARREFTVEAMLKQVETVLFEAVSGRLKTPGGEAPRRKLRQSSPPRLAMITLHFPPKDGGVARWSYHLARELGEVFRHCLVLARDRELAPNDRFKDDPFRLIRMKGHNWNIWRHLYTAVYTIGMFLTSPGRTVFLAATWDMGAVPLLLSTVLPIRVINAAHGLEVARPTGQLTSALFRLSLRRSSAWIAVSGHVGRLLIAKGAPPERVHVVPNGVQLESLHPSDEGEAVRRELGLGPGPVIITVSRIIERKGHDMVVRALPRIAEAFPDVRYLIVGKGNTDKLTALARESGVADRVVFAGFVPDERLRAYYNAADLFIMASRELADRGDIEGFGIVFLEAGACGLPVIGGRSGGIPDAVRHGQTGLLVDPESPDDIAAVTTKILGDPETARRMGEAGRRLALSLSWKNIAGIIAPIVQAAMDEFQHHDK